MNGADILIAGCGDVGGALAETVGVSLSGVVEGVGGLFKGLLGR